MRTAAILLATIALLVLAGCGGNDNPGSSSVTSTDANTGEAPTKTISRKQARKARHIRTKTMAKVNKVCRRADVQLDLVKISVGDSPRKVEKRAAKLSRSYENAAKGLDAIKAYASQSRRDIGTGVNRASQMLDDASRVLAEIKTIAEGGDLSTIGPQVKRLNSDIGRYQTTVRNYGFTDCY